MSALLGLFLASLLSCAGQLCQKQAACAPAGPHRLRHVALWLLFALVLLALALLLWLVALQQLPVGVAYPMLSLNFVWVTLAARLIWQEPLTWRHALGIGVIMLGVMLLGGVDEYAFT